jgi:hypothetical protein
MRNAVAIGALIIFIVGVCQSTSATPLFETATGSPLTTGLVVNNFLFPFHRFEVTSSVQLVSVGGFFENLTGADRKIFGAVVGLSGPNDVPDSLDLTTSDLIGTTLINVLLGSGDFSGSLSLGLTPGWYALGLARASLGPIA